MMSRAREKIPSEIHVHVIEANHNPLRFGPINPRIAAPKHTTQLTFTD